MIPHELLKFPPFVCGCSVCQWNYEISPYNEENQDKYCVYRREFKASTCQCLGNHVLVLTPLYERCLYSICENMKVVK